MKPLWKRGADAEDGVYQLPSLEDGSYYLRAQPISAADTPLPLLPQRRSIVFFAHIQEPLTMDFVPGVVLQLEAAADGGQERQCDVVVSSRSGPLRTAWRSLTTAGRTVVGDDTVMLPGMATTLLALPAGDYTVTATIGGQPVALQSQGEDSGVRSFTVQLPR